MNKFNMVSQNQKLETEERTTDIPEGSEQTLEVRYAEMKWFFEHWRLLEVALKVVAILK
jgi:hypothetical protein